MLDIKFVREHPDKVKQDLEKRKAHDKVAWVDAILQYDEDWRSCKNENDKLRSERNSLSKQVNETKKTGGDITELLAKVKAIPEQIRALDEKMGRLQHEIRTKLMRLPNITSDDVPFGETDEDNVELAQYGKKSVFDFPPKNHTELIETMNIVELERAAKIAGSRFYFLQGDLAIMEHALKTYALQFMAKKGYIPIFPPHMMNKAAYEGVTDLADFEEVLYKIENHDLHLIATSEHPLTAQFMGETLENLPIKLVGLSPCYRKETGSHGKEEKGVWRVHSFNKVEQVIICKPEQSEMLLEELIANAREFFESLGLHFRQVLICTGDLGIVASKKYDLEAWIPSVNEYKEIVSASNCTTYQAVRMNIKYRENNENNWVHTLNATCVATSRALAAILEQNQQKDGSIVIPKVLQPFVGKKTISPVAKF